jgi:hypothetical protein
MTPNEQERPHRRWQNLLHKVCPNCNTPMQEYKMYFICPNEDPKDETRNCFFIKKTTAAQYLLDVNHPANFCLSYAERETVESTIKALGLKE